MAPGTKVLFSLPLPLLYCRFEDKSRADWVIKKPHHIVPLSHIKVHMKIRVGVLTEVGDDPEYFFRIGHCRYCNR